MMRRTLAWLGCAVLLWGAGCTLDWRRFEGTPAEPGGGSMGCLPEQTRRCYPGPPSTEGVGLCVAGEQRCLSDGSGYGECVGAVLPASREDCTTGQDDDCDGQIGTEDADCLCAPDSIVKCYDGPLPTEGVGACKAGSLTCSEDGTVETSCEDQVLPAPEECVTLEDDDCDGMPNEGCPVDALSFGGTNHDELLAMARFGSGSGRVVLVGRTRSSNLHFGSTKVSTGSPLLASKAFIVMFESESKLFGKKAPLGARVDGAAGDDGYHGVVEWDSKAYVIGTLSGFDDCAALYDFAVQDGTNVSKACALPGDPPTTLGALNVLIPAKTSHAVVLAIDTTGSVAWVTSFGSSQEGDEAEGAAIAVSPIGHLLVGGHFDGEFTASDAVNQKGKGAWWGQLDAMGAVRAGSFSVSEDYERVEAVEWIENKSNSLFPSEAYAVALRKSTHQVEVRAWRMNAFDRLTSGSTLLEGSDVRVTAIVRDRESNPSAIMVFGDAKGSLKVGEKTVTMDGTDGFMAELRTNGKPKSSGTLRVIGGAGALRVHGATRAADNTFWLGMSMAETVDFGGGAISTTSSSAWAVARYDDTGQYQSAFRFGDSLCKSGAPRALMFSTSGALIAGGDFDGILPYGPGEKLSGFGGIDAGILRFAP